MGIAFDTVLARAPELVVELDSANDVRIHHAQGVWKFGHHALGLLDAFHSPAPVSDALRRLGPRLAGERALTEAVTTLGELVSAGILTTAQQPGFTELMFPRGGYGLAYANIRMLDDPMRKSLFVRAVQDVVEPGDVVLDLGTGSGILAVAAAKAGAACVYAVEPARTVGVARLLAEQNGVADRITFVQDWSSSLSLPAKANVLTSDIVGNDALDMMIWETVQDARRRLLTPDARLVPGALRAYACLVEMPADRVAEHRIVPAHIDEWNTRYGMDFTPFLELDRERVAGFYEPPALVRQWPRLSAPAALYRVDLREDARVFDGEATLTVTQGGLASGVIVYFEADLAPGTVLSTDPANGDPRSHWFTAGWAFPEPAKVTEGDEVTVVYHYEGDGRAQVRLAGAQTVQEG